MVLPSWITDSVKRKKRLPVDAYLLPQLYAANQRRCTHFFAHTDTSHDGESEKTQQNRTKEKQASEEAKKGGEAVDGKEGKDRKDALLGGSNRGTSTQAPRMAIANVNTAHVNKRKGNNVVEGAPQDQEERGRETVAHARELVHTSHAHSCTHSPLSALPLLAPSVNKHDTNDKDEDKDKDRDKDTDKDQKKDKDIDSICRRSTLISSHDSAINSNSIGPRSIDDDDTKSNSNGSDGGGNARSSAISPSPLSSADHSTRDCNNHVNSNEPNNDINSNSSSSSNGRSSDASPGDRNEHAEGRGSGTRRPPRVQWRGETRSTKSDPNFVQHYFSSSRLHHIGTCT